MAYDGKSEGSLSVDDHGGVVDVSGIDSKGAAELISLSRLPDVAMARFPTKVVRLSLLMNMGTARFRLGTNSGTGSSEGGSSMNAIEVRDTERLPVAKDTANLIRAGVTDNTLKAYRHATQKLEAWLNGQVLNDGLLADYITQLHTAGKSPSTISLVVAAVKWTAKHTGTESPVSVMTGRTLSGIRRAGKGRGRGQVSGLTWQAVERVCAFAESRETLAGLRDSSMIRLMSDCLLRIGEAVAVDIKDVGDVLTIHQSKTDQEAEGAKLYIAEAGVDGFISGHSLRVGSAVSLAQAGATVVDMQTAGRWADPKMPAHYAAAETGGTWGDCSVQIREKEVIEYGLFGMVATAYHPLRRKNRC